MNKENAENAENAENEIKNKVNEAVKLFYNLKNVYEEKYYEEKKTIMANLKLSLKEKRFEFKKLRPKCINCQRPVTTIFETKVNNDLDRVLKAMCGDRENPCNLDIEINLGITHDIRDLINEDEIETIKLKNQIILDKNDYLFGYITSEEAVNKFEEVKENIKSNIENSEYFLTILNETTDNIDKKKDMKKIQTELYTNIDNIKKSIEEYNRTQNKQLLKDVASIYADDMVPRLKKLMEYKYMEAYVDVIGQMRYLIENKISLESLEFSLGDNTGIKKMKYSFNFQKNKSNFKSDKNDKKSRANKSVRQTKDYYAELEIQKNASPAEIKSAYRKLALKWHPDRVDEQYKNQATEKFQKIGEAYEVLSNPESKQRYDDYGMRGGSIHENKVRHGDDDEFKFSPSDPIEIFRKVFGNEKPK